MSLKIVVRFLQYLSILLVLRPYTQFTWDKWLVNRIAHRDFKEKMLPCPSLPSFDSLAMYESAWKISCMQGGGGYSKKFYTGRLCPEVQPYTLLYTIFSEKAPLSYTFYWKKVPLSYTFLRKLMNKSLKQEVFLSFFHVVRNKWKWIISCVCLISFNTRKKIFPPFHIPKLVKSLPFYIPEAWKRYPFRAEPLHIGHYREYPPWHVWPSSTPWSCL